MRGSTVFREFAVGVDPRFLAAHADVALVDQRARRSTRGSNSCFQT